MMLVSTDKEMADDHNTVIEDVNDENMDDLVEPEPVFCDGMLSFVGGDLSSIPDTLINDFADKTRRLDLSSNCLRNLNGLERCDQLEELILDNNMLDDNVRFPVMKKMHTLTLNKNHITNLDHLLDNLHNNVPNLTYLSLLGNAACPNQLSSSEKDEEDYQRYRYYVLYRLPNLRFLDSSNVKTDELVEAKRVGPFMQVVSVTDDEVISAPEEKSPNNPFTPLPNTTKSPEKPIAFYGKCVKPYHGIHSEGNRFIRNRDL